MQQQQAEDKGILLRIRRIRRIRSIFLGFEDGVWVWAERESPSLGDGVAFMSLRTNDFVAVLLCRSQGGSKPAPLTLSK